MQINIPDPITQTIIFTALLLLAVILTIKKGDGKYNISPTHTDELKGLAILMVIFSHAGYFLSTDTRFLFPLSVAGGVGVNIFLFLSGFGLTISAIKSKPSILNFYFKRLSKIYPPMWIVLALFFLADFFYLGKSYSTDSVIQNFLGFFPKAHIFYAVDSPLWYFTPIVFYYLIFPLLFWRKWPVISAIAILLVGAFVTRLNLPIDKDVLKLYQLHILAFPLGMGFAVLLEHISKVNWTSMIFQILKPALIILLAFVVGYTAIHSGIGESLDKEQLISLVTVSALIGIVLLKNFQSRFLIILGIYSYEIYLIQWPLAYRYDFLYKFLPASVATLVYLGLYILLAIGLNKLVKLVRGMIIKDD